ncbi:MAG: prepilin-type N-terminal cleavage/methylation domain-containing protein [Acidobacteriia bacterium]|nr:prepilin-type N-terminal cleavage/methylation domain-containing protein [Terriglobia bacterium]
MKNFRKGQAGFSLIEMMVAMAVLLIVAGVVMRAMMQMMNVQGTLANRSEMHSGLRSATELLQQEIGQAGKVSVPPYPWWWNPAWWGNPPLLMATAVTGATATNPVTMTVSVSGANAYYTGATAGMFNGEYLVIDVGNNTTLAGSPDNQETVQISNLQSNAFTATFFKPHLANVPILVQGAFATGVVPPDTATLTAQGVAGVTGQTNGSNASVLKLYGDLNGDGNMMYAEYVCDTVNGNLYRNVMAFDTPIASKPQRTPSMIVLNNLLPNPANAAGVQTPCFTYYVKPIIIAPATSPTLFVVNVEITLTAQTAYADPQTHVYQKESKALLNVSPRNVFQGWMLAGLGANNRVQPMPATIGDASGTTGLISTTP